MKNFKGYYNEISSENASQGGGASSGSASVGTSGNSVVNASSSSGTTSSLLASGGMANSETNNVGSETTSESAVSAVGTQNPWFVELWDKTGNINQAAFDKLPDHLKQHKATFSKYKTVEAFMGGYANLAQLAGKKGLAPLPADANDEMKAERATLMRQLNGVPEKPEDYGIKRPENYPETAWNEGYVNDVVSTLHKFNAPPELVKALVAIDSKHAETSIAASTAKQQEAVKAEINTLRKEWGNDYSTNLSKAARAAETLGLDPNDPVFASASMVKAMVRVADMVSESKLVSGNSSSGLNGHDDMAKSRDIVFNKANPLYEAYHNPNHAQHQYAVDMKQNFSKAALARKTK